MAKKYVEVCAVFKPDGRMIPILLWWDDRRKDVYKRQDDAWAQKQRNKEPYHHLV